MPENKKIETEEAKRKGCLKILYLYKILSEKTDSEHSLTMPELQRELKKCGAEAGRKSIYEYIDALRSLGVEIDSELGKGAGYSLAARTFDLPELKLLADAVASSRFFTERKAKALIAKLESLCSEHEAKSLRRQVYIANRLTTDNERIYYNVNEIHRAINEKRMISFKYFDYDIRKRKKYRDGVRVCSPYALTWNDEKYYLIAHYEKYGSISHFRVDKMEDVRILDEPAQKMPRGFKLSDYMGSTFSMFSGEVEDVKLRFSNSLIGAVIDRFGKQITLIPDGGGHFTVKVPVRASSPEPFFGWLFQFGENAQILSPQALREEYIKALNQAAKANK